MRLKEKRKEIVLINLASNFIAFKLYNDVWQAISLAILEYRFPNIFMLMLALSFLQKNLTDQSSFKEK